MINVRTFPASPRDAHEAASLDPFNTWNATWLCKTGSRQLLSLLSATSAPATHPAAPAGFGQATCPWEDSVRFLLCASVRCALCAPTIPTVCTSAKFAQVQHAAAAWPEVLDWGVRPLFYLCEVAELAGRLFTSTTWPVVGWAWLGASPCGLACSGGIGPVEETGPACGA